MRSVSPSLSFVFLGPTPASPLEPLDDELEEEVEPELDDDEVEPLELEVEPELDALELEPLELEVDPLLEEVEPLDEELLVPSVLVLSAHAAIAAAPETESVIPIKSLSFT